ncbi:MAG: hypothetical protein GTO45_20785 [Candidatus Aminicenantes bacterium]|nr:hypothetical protein [Candidatus Aminicenantes bacterium]NIM81224.1 hypothetical protein [Candidatus Aminicenantes bacterium]NIN20599.1 hypothetical protein [Candidatus Aminicenantes bacterium]NIN44378.1 hypothetical protein [Candidatus Aminicenantes bacterium]NIN87197.1 hypothetical protein [Candidatus Aminicenantes bacterium]
MLRRDPVHRTRTHYKSPKLFQWADLFELIAVPSISEEIFHKLETAKQIFSNEIKLFQHQKEVGIISEPRSHEGHEEKKKRMGEGMDSKGSVMVKVLMVIILLIIWLFFYA